MPNIAIQNEAEWHAQRKKNIGASEVSALFGANPYTTKFELWHVKSGNIEPMNIESNRTIWGTRLEPAIAHGIAKDQKWKIRKTKRYITHPFVDGLGCSLDYEIINHPDGPGCFEVKNVALDSWRDKWDGENEEAPLHIEIQLQAQMACTGWQWGALGVLVGGNEQYVFTRQRHEKTIRKIESAVRDFWFSVMEKKEPKVFTADDFEVVKLLYKNTTPGTVADLSDDIRIAELCRVITETNASTKELKKQIDAAKAELLAIIGDAEKAIHPGFKISAKTVERKGYTVEPTSYRNLTVTKEKEN